MNSRQALVGVAPFPVSLALAVFAGWVMDLGFPDRDWWPLALVGAALMMVSVRGHSLGKALIIGAVGGFSFYGIHIWWLTVYLGLVPWIALTLAQVFFFSGSKIIIQLLTLLIDYE